MEFEVLSDHPKSLSLMEEAERFLTNRKATVLRWVKTPPTRLAVAVFFLVVTELSLGTLLMGGKGLFRAFVPQFFVFATLILLVEILLAAIAAQAAEIFKTTGSTGHLLTFFNVGLTPLLLLLPVTMLTWTSRAGVGARMFLMALLLVKVVGNWRESLELVYKFSKMQSAIVMYAASSVAFLLLMLAGYAVLFNRFASLLI